MESLSEYFDELIEEATHLVDADVSTGVINLATLILIRIEFFIYFHNQVNINCRMECSQSSLEMIMEPM